MREKDPLQVTEKELLQQVRELASLCGWLVYHTYDSSKVIFAELKSEKGRVRPQQRMWLDALEKVRKAEACLWRPSDWSKIVEVLR